MTFKTELAQLLLEYSDSIVSEKYIEKLIDTVVRKKELQDYLINYEIDKNNTGRTQAKYNPRAKTIILYPNSKAEKHNYYDMICALTLTNREYKIYTYSTISQMILHELEHANQEKIKYRENGLESDILRLSDFDYDRIPPMPISYVDEYFKNHKELSDEEMALKYIELSDEYEKECFERYMKIYRQNYLYAPNERLAEIKSVNEIIEALDLIDSDKVMQHAVISKYESMRCGYHDTYSPTIKYFEAQGKKEELKSFDWYSEDEEKTKNLSKEIYCLQDRIKYGLPLYDEENEKLEKDYIKSLMLRR